jgi:excisionase family DNA binding protein
MKPTAMEHSVNQPIQQDSETLWTAEDVASYLKVSRSWVYHRAESGRLPHVRVGGLIRFQPHEIRSFVDSTAQAPARAKSLSSSRRALHSAVKG